MHDDYRAKLKRVAPAYLFFFQELQPWEQAGIWLLLPTGVQKTIEIIESIQDCPRTYKELATLHEQSVVTISQKLNALSEGGFPLILDSESAEASISIKAGRPKAIARVKFPNS